MPVGGIKEKCMAAHRNNIKMVILPEKNKKDAEEIPDDVKEKLTICFVNKIEEVLELALESKVEDNSDDKDMLFRAKL